MTLTEVIEYEATQYQLAAFAIKEYTVIKRDGVEISRGKPHTVTVTPDSDISMLPEEVQGMCNGYWTSDIRDKYTESLTVSE